MTALEITICSVSALALIIISSFFYIRHRYRIFCQKEDQKERISIIKREILSAKDFVRTTYSTPMDHSVADNIIPKIDFLLKIIQNKDMDGQEKEMRTLRDMLTETFVRLRTNYMDVAMIVSPLNTLRDRLVQEHLDWLKEHMDEDPF